MAIHYARLDSSPRLKSLYSFLSDGREHTTLQIIVGTGLCAINTAVAELRKNNIPVNCRCVSKGVYAYQLTELAAA